MILLLTAVGGTSALAVKIVVLVALVMLRMVLMLLTMMPAVKRGFGSELELIFFSFVSIPHFSLKIVELSRNHIKPRAQHHQAIRSEAAVKVSPTTQAWIDDLGILSSSSSRAPSWFCREFNFNISVCLCCPRRAPSEQANPAKAHKHNV